MEGQTYTHRSPSSSQFLTIFLTLLLFISSTQLVSATSTAFIKTKCSSTTYPKLCYQSLFSYASEIKSNPLTLANTALTVALKAARNTSSVVSTLSKQKGLTSTEAGIIKDCIENIRDSIYELQDSLKAMDHLRAGSNSKMQMANIKTWVSAAITDVSTCTDGFDGTRKVHAYLKNKISNSISNVGMLTSNALAIINSLSYK